ncbi:MAG: hypothetical protein ABFC24_09260 [Methanoregulaceae archaeon]
MALCRENLSRQFYSRELVQMIFVQSYREISFLAETGMAKRQTAAEYLQNLEDMGVRESRRVGRENFFTRLF